MFEFLRTNKQWYVASGEVFDKERYPEGICYTIVTYQANYDDAFYELRKQVVRSGETGKLTAPNLDILTRETANGYGVPFMEKDQFIMLRNPTGDEECW